jgi:hypothetical protein
MPGCVAPGGLTMRERAALALVIFGHVGCIEAAGELAISPADMAALLLAVLCKLSADDDHLARADPCGAIEIPGPGLAGGGPPLPGGAGDGWDACDRVRTHGIS